MDRQDFLRLIDSRLAKLAPIAPRSSLTRAKIDELNELRRLVEGPGDRPNPDMEVS